MSKRPRRNYSPTFEAKGALAAVEARRRWPSRRSGMMYILISRWRSRLEGAADVFGADPAAAEPAVDVTVLHAKISGAR